MKILVVHQFYLMAGDPGGSRFNEMARLWTDSGHEVTVIAGAVNYSTGKKPEKYRRRWVLKEQEGGVTIWRCHVSESYLKGTLGRAWAFVLFTLSASTAAVLAGKADVVIATSPPLFASIPGWIAARLRRVPFIFEIRDLWPEGLVTVGVLNEGSRAVRVLYGLEKWACRRAAMVNVLTPAFREDLLRRHLAPAEKIAFVPNGADVASFRPVARENGIRNRFHWDGKFVAMYTGAHGRANHLEQLLDAAERLRDRPDVVIASVGDGAERGRLQADAVRRGLRNLVFCGPQPKEAMPDFVSAADVGLAVLQDNPTYRTVYPNKIFDYMAAERPVVLAVDGVARQLVCAEAQAGVFVPPGDGTELARAIRELADDPARRLDMGRKGRAWVLANATRESLAARYLELLEQLVRG